MHIYHLAACLKLTQHYEGAVCGLCSVDQLCAALCDPHGLQPTRLLCPWDSPGKNTGVGCHALLQGIFPTQGWNLRLLCLMSPASAGGSLH